jgi:hypothetical protein
MSLGVLFIVGTIIMFIANWRHPAPKSKNPIIQINLGQNDQPRQPGQKSDI